MIQYLLNGLLIGLIFGMPIGAVGAMSIQRTMYYGPTAGFISGLASSCADALYACVGAFGLTIISNVLLVYQTPINLLGAFFLIGIAIKILRVNPSLHFTKEYPRESMLMIFLSSFMVAITNPAAIMSFLFAFSIFKISGLLSLIDGIQLIIGVFIGTLCWWGILVLITNSMKQKLDILWLRRLNIAFGMILIICSSAIIIKTL